LASVVKGPGLPHTDYKVGTEIQAYDSVDVTGGGGSKRSPFGAPDYIPTTDSPHHTPILERLGKYIGRKVTQFQFGSGTFF